jgi:hypothetical protein
MGQELPALQGQVDAFAGVLGRTDVYPGVDLLLVGLAQRRALVEHRLRGLLRPEVLEGPSFLHVAEADDRPGPASRDSADDFLDQRAGQRARVHLDLPAGLRVERALDDQPAVLGDTRISHGKR